MHNLLRGVGKTKTGKTKTEDPGKTKTQPRKNEDPGKTKTRPRKNEDPLKSKKLRAFFIYLTAREHPRMIFLSVLTVYMHERICYRHLENVLRYVN